MAWFFFAEQNMDLRHGCSAVISFLQKLRVGSVLHNTVHMVTLARGGDNGRKAVRDSKIQRFSRDSGIQ
jgi:hypothetical protein